ncbi:MAG: hypothetical protein ACYDER_19550 [Ktedonobacteraceae bacterium]
MMMIETRRLCKSFGSHVVLDGINLDVEEGRSSRCSVYLDQVISRKISLATYDRNKSNWEYAKRVLDNLL